MEPMIPATYAPPLGLPLGWQNERTGLLAEAVLCYFGASTGEGAITDMQVRRVVVFLQHYINAPCWTSACNGDADDLAILAGLRERATKLATVQDINRFLDACLEQGMDPL